jgi:hypothetical protein
VSKNRTIRVPDFRKQAGSRKWPRGDRQKPMRETTNPDPSNAWMNVPDACKSNAKTSMPNQTLKAKIVSASASKGQRESWWSSRKQKKQAAEVANRNNPVRKRI